MKQINKLAILVFLILALSLFSRSFRFADRFIYAHDSDLASWMVKDIVVNHHPRLIGQLTSSPGIFIGPLFYYALIPFYFLTGMDPIGSLGFSWLVGVLTTFSVYWTFSRMSGQKTGLIGALLHALSYNLSATDREVVPTTPVLLWTVWFLYWTRQLEQGRVNSLLPLAALFALVWHLNLALGLLAGVVILVILVKKLPIKPLDYLKSFFLGLVLSLPLLVFEFRHNFQQVRALFSALSQIGAPSAVSTDLFSRLGHTAAYLSKNASRILLPDMPDKYTSYFPVILSLAFTFLAAKNPKNRGFLLIFAPWLVLYWLFFSFHPINLSEYYLNGLNIVWIFSTSYIVAAMLQHHAVTRFFIICALALFAYFNLHSQLTATYSNNGYIQKKALVQAIASDSAAHSFPCVAVSYITDPGYDFGYRYFFYLKNLHVNRPSSQSPVYSIVFPLSRVDRVDATFGSLGLIYPDYNKYTPEEIRASCQGSNANVTDPMFGFTN